MTDESAMVRAESSTMQTRGHLEEANLGDLVSGIAKDSRKIASGYVALAKEEVRHEIENAKMMAALGSVGGVVAVVGLLLLAVGAAYALAQYTVLSVAGGYAVVGGAAALAGMVFLLAASRVRKVREHTD